MNPSNNQEERIRELEKKIEELSKNSNPAPKKSPSSNNNVAVIIIPIMIVVAIALFWSLKVGLKGNFSAQGTALGTWSAEAKHCRSGAAFIPQFWGVSVLNKQKNLKFTLQDNPGQGPKILVWGSQDQSSMISFDRKDCSVFDVKVERNGTRTNGVIGVEGHVKVSCKLENTDFNADVSFENCN